MQRRGAAVAAMSTPGLHAAISRHLCSAMHHMCCAICAMHPNCPRCPTGGAQVKCSLLILDLPRAEELTCQLFSTLLDAVT